MSEMPEVIWAGENIDIHGTVIGTWWVMYQPELQPHEVGAKYIRADTAPQLSDSVRELLMDRLSDMDQVASEHSPEAVELWSRLRGWIERHCSLPQLSAEDAQILELVRLARAANEGQWVNVHLRWMLMKGEWRVSARTLNLTPTEGDFVSLADAITELRKRLKPAKPTKPKPSEKTIIAYARELVDGVCDPNYETVRSKLERLLDDWDAWQEWEREHNDG